MENSPLRFLDYDVSQMLADQVRASQEEESRKFHSDNFENSHEIDLNRDDHYLLASVFDIIYSNIEDNPLDLSRDRSTRGKTWFELSIHERRWIFEDERGDEEDWLILSGLRPNFICTYE